jgi:hypothetical protein
MSMTQAIVLYALAFMVLLFGLGLSLWGARVSWPKLSSLANWRKRFDQEKQNFANGEFWLKVLLATFIALCGGVSLAVFIFPYGSGWVVIGLLASLLLLAVLLPYLLA